MIDVVISCWLWWILRWHGVDYLMSWKLVCDLWNYGVGDYCGVCNIMVIGELGRDCGLLEVVSIYVVAYEFHVFAGDIVIRLHS